MNQPRREALQPEKEKNRNEVTQTITQVPRVKLTLKHHTKLHHMNIICVDRVIGE